MNPQGEVVNGKVIGGIEWVKTFNPDGTESLGYTWNPIGGCLHGCRWIVGDVEYICYAENSAESYPASIHYPEGFEHHYWHPHRLEQPLNRKKPARIFLDSMSDLMGNWVPADQIQQVLDVCRQAHWHTFLLLTKNAPRLLQFDYPDNVHVGVSSPPDIFKGKRLSLHQQQRMLLSAFENLRKVNAPIKWMSAEPLSWDMAELFNDCGLQWVVVGAVSAGPRYYQPQPEHVEKLLAVLDAQNIPVFFKGNLTWSPWREEYPDRVAI